MTTHLFPSRPTVSLSGFRAATIFVIESCLFAEEVEDKVGIEIKNVFDLRCNEGHIIIGFCQNTPMVQ